MQAILYGPSGVTNTPQTAALVDPSFGAIRTSVRPLEYQYPGTVLGHYRAVAFSGAVNTISAAGILQSIRWVSSNALMVLERYSVITEITAAITVAAPIDIAAFVFRGASAASSGSGSTTLTGALGSNNQKVRGSMGNSLLLKDGEVRTIGTTTALTASASKVNDGAPFGAAMFGTQIAPNVGATGNVTAAIASLVTGWQDLYSIQSPYQHPIVLANNEGIEAQVVTATATTGGIKYGFLLEWAEVLQF